MGDDTSYRKIIFHIGGTKTGSSALQNFFETNHQYFEQSDFSYENRVNINSNYKITSGNGCILFDKLRTNKTTDDQFDHLIQSYFGKSINCICSSELLSLLNADEWTKIHQSCNRLGVDYIIIMYIRNLVPFFYSAYNQQVKRGGYFGHINSFALDFPWVHLDTLKAIYKSIPIENIKVFHYDSIRKNIVKHFFSIIELGEDIDTDDVFYVNRSLTPVEINFMRGLNKFLGRKYSDKLSDSLIYARPNINANPRYDPFVINILAKKFKSDIEWINDKFFGKTVVGLLPEPDDKKTTDLVYNSTQESDKEESLVMRTLCRCIADLSLPDKVQQRIFNFSKSILALTSKPNLCLTDIPDDFSPIAYLLLNPDIVYSGVNAYEHYSNHGYFEAREYKFISERFGKSSEKFIYNDLRITKPVGTILTNVSSLSMPLAVSTNLELIIANHGQEDWMSGIFRTISLSYHWYDYEWNVVAYDRERSPLPTDIIRSGQTITSSIIITPPVNAGIYYLVVTIVQDHVGWFDEIGYDFNPAILEVTISGG